MTSTLNVPRTPIVMACSANSTLSRRSPRTAAAPAARSRPNAPSAVGERRSAAAPGSVTRRRARRAIGTSRTPATTIATADRPSTSGAPPMPSRSPASSDPTSAPAPSTSPDATFARGELVGRPCDLRQQRREQRTHERHQCHRHHAEGEAEQRRAGQEGERGARQCDGLRDVRPEQHPRPWPAVAED